MDVIHKSVRFVDDNKEDELEGSNDTRDRYDFNLEMFNKYMAQSEDNTEDSNPTSKTMGRLQRRFSTGNAMAIQKHMPKR